MSQLTKCSILFGVVAIVGLVRVVAAPASIMERAMYRMTPVGRIGESICESSPATMLLLDSLSMSEISVDGVVGRLDESYMMQLGKGCSLWSVNAESYMRMPSNSVVWGEASFTSGVRRDVKWTDCVDYLLVAPYVLGDAVGGDLSMRRYEFGGGWAKGYGRTAFGIEASYRAEVDYRNRDPRVKTVVSDLNVKIGAAYRLTDNRYAGLSAGINVYNQNCDLDFYNPMNDINTYTLTGLGTYYARFMGNLNKNSGYNSFGYSVGLQFVPSDGDGFSAYAMYEGRRVEQLLRNYNNLTLGYTDTDVLSGRLCYKVEAESSFTFMPFLEGAYVKRDGTENLFGSVSAGSYPKIGSRAMYHHRRLSAALLMPVQWVSRSGHTAVALTAKVRYISDHEWYLQPKRDVDVAHWRPELRLDFSTRSDSWMWSLSAGMSRSFAKTRTAVFTGLDMTDDLGKCVMHNFEMLASGFTSADIDVRVAKPFDGRLFGLDIRYSRTAFSGHGASRMASIALNVTF